MKTLLAALAAAALTISAAQAAELSEVDTDGNGTVSMEEAKAAMPDMTEEAFKAADADESGELNEEELAKLSE
jgi:Ca2+-binding EF-hand superfamily protein